MDPPGTPSASGPSRRSRRLQGTPATTAAGSPYARRPPLPRDPSSHTLAAIEGGSSRYSPEPSTFASARKDVAKANRRKSAGPEGLFGRVRKSLGWLVGRSSTDTAEDDEENNDDQAAHSSSRATDEESAMDGRNTAASRAMDGPSKLAKLPSHIPAPPPKRNFTQTASIASRSQLGSTTGDDEDPYAPKRLRTSHSTLNLPTAPSVPSNLSHASAGPLYSRSRSPTRNPSPSRLGPGNNGSYLPNSASSNNIFQARPQGLTASSTFNRLASPSRRSVSPGEASQSALVLPNSATSSTFGLTSQSPFRCTGHPAQSPDFSVLNISSGLARSPSVPRERMAVQQGSRLYPYQRSPSVTSAFSRPAGTMPISYSLNTGLNGTKRGFGNISVSPPRISPIHGSLFQQQAYAGSNISPTNTDFSLDNPHRPKRQRMSIVWDPERGFVTSDADGRPVQEEPKQEVPKNEAERILERLENLRRPQIQGLRSRSPQRINVPLPAANTPTNGDIFATRITASQSTPMLASHAISPYARRQRAAEEQSARERDRIRSNGGLGERMRRDQVEREQRRKRIEEPTNVSGDEEDDRQSKRDASPQAEEQPSEQEDKVEDLPQPSNKRRTRQRTRELSVMSDASDMQQDEQAFSPRRSTRNKGKGRAREESQEPEQQQPKRQPKSAKSPPPAKRAPAKEAKKTKQAEVHSEEETDGEDEAPAPAKNKKRAGSARPTSPPPKAAATRNKKRPASPETAKEAPASIDQVMQKDDKDSQQTRKRRSPAREVAPVLSKRFANGFSAKDVEDEEMEVEQNMGAARPRTAEVAKLKLPQSVFANRFSFGKSPSSPVLAAQQNKLPEIPSGTPVLATSNGALPTVAGAVATVAPPAFSFAPATAAPASVDSGLSTKATTVSSPAAPASDSTPVTAPKATAPLFSFAKPAEKAAESATPAAAPAPTGGLFSFKPPASNATPVETAPTASRPLFSFNTPVTTAPASAEPAAKTPLFTFGAKPAEKPAAPADTATSIAASEQAPAAPAFSFAKPNGTPVATPTPSVAADNTASNPFAAFPAASKAKGDAPETPAKAPSFSFGATPAAAPSFSFGKTADTDKNGSAATASKPNFGAFNFGGTTSGTAAKDAHTMSDSPPAATTATQPPTSAPFSPVIQASKAPAFSFGAPAASTPAAAPAPTGGFTFGASVNKPASETTKPNNPFGGASSTSGGFSFGATPAAQSAAPSRAGSQPPAGFPGSGNSLNNGNSTPSFTFGQPVASPAATTPAVSNPFGGTPAANTAKAANPFGAAPANPASTPGVGGNAAFTFGNPAPAASSPAPFTFGQPATAFNNVSSAPPTPGFGAGSPSTFTFGAPNNTNGTAAPFQFGSNTTNAQPAMSFGAGMPSGPTTPGGTAMAGGGSLFNMGSADTATSPNKSGRVIKPIRRRQQG